jgi:redox-sensitive bicupin YhaK (pirin superfamily)
MPQYAAASVGEPHDIAHRTGGRFHGPITWLVSPSDLGPILKPFVLFDYFGMRPRPFSGLALHPHSGIATLTHLEGRVRREDTSGAAGRSTREQSRG